jgi:hypothetical protein
MFQTYIDYTKHIFEMLEFDVKEVPVITGMRNEPAHERKGLDTVLKDTIHRWSWSFGTI